MARYAVRHGEVVKISDETASVADVYFRRPYLDENLSDGSQPVEVRSRAHKAALMKARGVREAGDRVHGSRCSSKTSTKDRLMAQNAAGLDRAFQRAREQLRGRT
mgnify:FL=1